jgi:phosphoribosylformimino-5-aminoimidazole carboxamide ribotide isomerase
MADAFPRRLMLGLDAREGRVATHGWLETSTIAAVVLAQQFDSLPLAGMIYTDIARDGTLEGPNLAAIDALTRSVQTPVLASGGVGRLEDLEQLAMLPIVGCIIGRALYEGRFSLSEALRLSDQGDQTP